VFYHLDEARHWPDDYHMITNKIKKGWFIRTSNRPKQTLRETENENSPISHLYFQIRRPEVRKNPGYVVLPFAGLVSGIVLNSGRHVYNRRVEQRGAIDFGEFAYKRIQAKRIFAKATLESRCSITRHKKDI